MGLAQIDHMMNVCGCLLVVAVKGSLRGGLDILVF